MRRDLKILLGTACLAAVAVGWPQTAQWIRGMDTFKVARVDVAGVRYLSEEEVVELLEVEAGTSVWGDPSVWTDRVAAHPLVREARVTRRLPDGLFVEVSERVPVALAPTPALEPVDAEGYRLPIDPVQYRMDLPVIGTDATPPEGARLVPDEVRRLAAEVERLMAFDTAFSRAVSSVTWTDRGALVVSWTEPPVDFMVPPEAPPTRLREGVSALADAMGKRPDATPTAVDLRFEDQVVIRRAGGRGLAP